MTYIMGKNRGDIIKTLKKTGDTILIAKAEIIYALPHKVNGLSKDELMREIKMQPKTYEYYRVGLIKITDIKEVEDEKEGVSQFTGTKENQMTGQSTDSKSSSIVICDECGCANGVHIACGKHVDENGMFIKVKPSERDCVIRKCPSYGECDHQGAYKKDGKWCWEKPPYDPEILEEIMASKAIPYIPLSERDECSHESHFISTKTECKKCKEKERGNKMNYQSKDQDSSGKIFEGKKVKDIKIECYRIEVKALNKQLSVIIDDSKQALDYLIDIIRDSELSKPTGMPRWSDKEKLGKYEKALELYNKHFVC